MAIQKEIKKLFKTQRRDETHPSIASPEMNSDFESEEVNLDLVIDASLFSQDFGSWFGKSVFDNELAVVIQKNFSGHVNLTLLDVLEMVAMLYNFDSTGAVKRAQTRDIVSNFYCGLYNSRCNLDDADWAAYRLELSSRIATSCEKLRKEKTAELHAESASPQSAESRAATVETTDSCENLSSSHSSALATVSASYVSAAAQQQGSVQHPSRSEHSHQTFQTLLNPAAPPAANVPPYRYISILQEHANACGKLVTYESTCLKSYPPLFHQKATYEGIIGEGTGRSLKLAKYAASKNLCGNIGLVVA